MDPRTRAPQPPSRIASPARLAARTRLAAPAEPPPELHEGLSLHGVASVLRRRRVHFAVPALLAAAGFAAAALLLPPRYRAEALVAVENPASAEPGAAAPDLDARLDRVEEELAGRAVLVPVIRHFGLYPVERIESAEIESMRERVRVRAEGPSTFSIAFEDTEPDRAAAVVARLVEELIGGARAGQVAEARAEVARLEARVRPLEERLAEQAGEIQGYQERWTNELPEAETSVLGLLESSRERVHANAATIAQLEARQSAIEQELAEIGRHDVAQDPAAARLEAARRDLERLRGRYTDQHPEVLRAQAEVAELARAAESAGAAALPEPSPLRLRQLELLGERQEVAQRLQSARAERGSLVAESADYRRRAEAAPRHELALEAMAREHEAATERHQELADRLQEARVAEHLAATGDGGFAVVEKPRVPAEPFAPNRPRIALMGLAVALGLGIGAAFLGEQMDTSIRDAGDLETPMNLPVLASIPRVGRGVRRLERAPGRAAGPASGPTVALLDQPRSGAAEQYRILATKLIGRGGEPQPTVLLVTSPTVGEGKTTTAVNLALALARMMRDESVLLVDADLGRPAAHRLLRLPLGNGLARLLASPEDDLGRYVRYHQGLYLLEAGEASQRTRSALASPLGQRVFARLRQRFDYIVVDAPPVLAVAEGLILQRMVDSILLVVRAGKTPRELVRRAVASLDSGRLAGVLLNDAPAGGPGYNARYYDGYYHGDHAGEDGAGEAPGGRRGILPAARDPRRGAELTGGRS